MEGQIKIDECVVDKSISKIQIEYESIWFGFYYVYEIIKKNIELINMKCHDLKHYVFAVGDVDGKKHGGHLRLCVQDGQRGVRHRAYGKEPYLTSRLLKAFSGNRYKMRSRLSLLHKRYTYQILQSEGLCIFRHYCTYSFRCYCANYHIHRTVRFRPFLIALHGVDIVSLYEAIPCTDLSVVRI